jgi:RNA polymerase sigma-70 factor (ECF subfamily)
MVETQDARSPSDEKQDAKLAANEARNAEDRAWVEASLDGDNAAFGRLVEKYQRRVYALAYGILRNREDAWDVSQEAFVKAYKALSTWQGDSAFYTWLYRITYNFALDTLRAKGRRDTVAIDETMRESDMDLEHIAQPEHPADVVDRRELSQVVGRAMAQLSEKHRAIIVLREIEGLSYEELAEVLKIPKGTVMSRLFHARRHLQERLEPYLKGDGLKGEGGLAAVGEPTPEGAGA